MLSMPFLQLTGKLAAWHYCSIGVGWRYQMTILDQLLIFNSLWLIKTVMTFGNKLQG